MSSAICCNLDQSKILSSGNGLSLYWTMTTSGVPKEKSFIETAWKKNQNAGNQLFSTMLSSTSNTNSIISALFGTSKTNSIIPVTLNPFPNNKF